MRHVFIRFCHQLLVLIPEVRYVCWRTTLFGAAILYGKNWEETANPITIICNKNCKMDDLANQCPQTGIRGPMHTLVTTPIVDATTISGIKYPARIFGHYKVFHFPLIIGITGEIWECIFSIQRLVEESQLVRN